MFSIDLTGQVALVTGGARGIGAAIARSLAAAGADIAVNYRKPGGPSEKPGQALVEEIKAMGRRAVLIPADISVKDEAGRLADQAAAELGGIDIVILNAARAPFKPFDRLLERELRSLVDMNFLAHIFVLQKTLAHLEARKGKAVFISSLGSRFYHPEYPLGWMKAAMENVVKSWAEAFGGRGVNVNAVCAGMVKTDNYRILRQLWPEVAYMPQDSFVEADEVAAATLFFCSSLASAVRGQTLIVDRGVSNALIRGFCPSTPVPQPAPEAST